MSGNKGFISSIFRKGLKGQAALIDVVLLGMFISILLVFSLYTSTISNHSDRLEVSYAESMMFSLMNYRNGSYGTFNNTGNMDFAEALQVYFCGPDIQEADLNGTARHLLDRMAPLYNYIFFASASAQDGKKQLWVWNSQPDVCASSITLTRFNLSLVCGTSDYFKPQLGIWPKWRDIPPKSSCAPSSSTSP